MFCIEKEFHFSASHQLNGLPDDHQCARLHGHNYILKVGLYSEVLDEVGFVVDYGKLGFIKEAVDETLDHRHLNDVFNFNPTSENICIYYAQEIVKVVIMEGWDNITMVEVWLSETPKTWAHFVTQIVRPE